MLPGQRAADERSNVKNKCNLLFTLLEKKWLTLDYLYSSAEVPSGVILQEKKDLLCNTVWHYEAAVVVRLCFWGFVFRSMINKISKGYCVCCFKKVFGISDKEVKQKFTLLINSMFNKNTGNKTHWHFETLWGIQFILVNFPYWWEIFHTGQEQAVLSHTRTIILYWDQCGGLQQPQPIYKSNRDM